MVRRLKLGQPCQYTELTRAFQQLGSRLDILNDCTFIVVVDCSVDVCGRGASSRVKSVRLLRLAAFSQSSQVFSTDSESGDAGCCEDIGIGAPVSGAPNCRSLAVCRLQHPLV